MRRAASGEVETLELKHQEACKQQKSPGERQKW